jgi:U3 small nucleolar RNA-associated protein 4
MTEAKRTRSALNDDSRERTTPTRRTRSNSQTTPTTPNEKETTPTTTKVAKASNSQKKLGKSSASKKNSPKITTTTPSNTHSDVDMEITPSKQQQTRSGKRKSIEPSAETTGINKTRASNANVPQKTSNKKSTKTATTKIDLQQPKGSDTTVPPKHGTTKKKQKQHQEDKAIAVDCNSNTTTEQQPPPTLDVLVHRIRNLHYHPKPILCIRACGDVVAISRDNGSVEIRGTQQKMRVLTTIAGRNQKPVQCLTWTSCGDEQQQERATLVGASRDGTIFVVDYEKGVFAGMTASGGGGVFALVSLSERLVAAGCEDGSVRIFRVALHQKAAYSMELVSTLPSTGAAVLSLAWAPDPTANSSQGPVGSVLYVGVSDGTIRRYVCHGGSASASIESCHWKSTVRMTVESLGKATPTKVWALWALSDGTLISGDSLGHVQFWNGPTGTLEQSFDQNENKADVLDFAVTSDECKVFASGVDSRVVCIQRQPAQGIDDRSNKWIISHAQRPHTHDVTSVEIFRRTSRDRQTSDEILCTGGLDTRLCTYFTDQGFQKARPKVYYPWPSSAIAIAKSARILVMLRETSVDIYQICGKVSNDENLPVPIPEDKTLLGTIQIEVEGNLSSAAISDNGKFLAVTDSSTLVMFELSFEGKGLDRSMKLNQLKMDGAASLFIQAMTFTANSDQLIAASMDQKIHFLSISNARIADGNDSMESGPIVTLSDTIVGRLVVDQASPVQSIFMSSDGSYFATLRNELVSSGIDVFKRDAAGAYQHWWTVPDLEMPCSAASFLINKDVMQIAVACVNFALYLFDVDNRALSKWSENAGYPAYHALPMELKQRTDHPVRLVCDPNVAGRIFVVRYSEGRRICKDYYEALEYFVA